jgi:hypothetical protein
MGYRRESWWSRLGYEHPFLRIAIIVVLFIIAGNAVCCGVIYLVNLPLYRVQKAFEGHLEAYLQEPGASPVGGPYTGSKIVVLDADKKTIDKLHLKLPREQRAAVPEDVGLIVWVTREERKVGSYIGGGSAYQWFYKVSVIDPSVPKVLERQTFAGSEPPSSISCPANSTSPCTGRGNEPVKQVVEYLKGLSGGQTSGEP